MVDVPLMITCGWNYGSSAHDMELTNAVFAYHYDHEKVASSSSRDLISADARCSLFHLTLFDIKLEAKLQKQSHSQEIRVNLNEISTSHKSPKFRSESESATVIFQKFLLTLWTK